ncbi:flavodoxin family protein [candidate division KSB1 bacterium]|nr:flavodoxin family protein [candidate division KSB1 bacterium]
MLAQSRRNFIKAAGAAALVGTAAKKVDAIENEILIVGVACSPRKGKTTAASVQAALDTAKSVDSKITVELIDLGGRDISGWKPPVEGQNVGDDFDLILPSFKAPNLGGIIIGTPVYFRNMSSLCAAFLERLSVMRQPVLQLANKAVGALSVGAYRNGGQELAIQQIQTAMLCHEAMIVGGKSGAFQGATLWNDGSDDITKDAFGMTSAKNLGMRVAEAALTLKG